MVHVILFYPPRGSMYMYYCPSRWRPGNRCYGNGPVNYFLAKPLFLL